LGRILVFLGQKHEKLKIHLKKRNTEALSELIINYKENEALLKLIEENTLLSPKALRGF